MKQKQLTNGACMQTLYLRVFVTPTANNRLFLGRGYAIADCVSESSGRTFLYFVGRIHLLVEVSRGVFGSGTCKLAPRPRPLLPLALRQLTDAIVGTVVEKNKRIGRVGATCYSTKSSWVVAIGNVEVAATPRTSLSQWRRESEERQREQKMKPIPTGKDFTLLCLCGLYSRLCVLCVSENTECPGLWRDSSVKGNCYHRYFQKMSKFKEASGEAVASPWSSFSFHRKSSVPLRCRV